MQARVVLLAGASGSGKTSLCGRLGLPVLTLDDFYRDGDDPALPHRFGIVDWDDPASWDAVGALETIHRLCLGGVADVPHYDIPSSHRAGASRLDLAGAPLLVAEGIFAAELVAGCRELGLLADAVCLALSPAVTFGRRLLRDLAESRKPPLTLVRRGLGLALAEPAMVRGWVDRGCRPMPVRAAERRIRELADRDVESPAGRDLPSGSDLAAELDLAVGSDLAAELDLAVGSDLAAELDLPAGADLPAELDLEEAAGARDLSR